MLLGVLEGTEEGITLGMFVGKEVGGGMGATTAIIRYKNKTVIDSTYFHAFILQAILMPLSRISTNLQTNKTRRSEENKLKSQKSKPQSMYKIKRN